MLPAVLARRCSHQLQEGHAHRLGAALKKADDVLSNRDRIRLAPEDAEMMINLMDAEPQPNEALAAAYKKRAEILGE